MRWIFRHRGAGPRGPSEWRRARGLRPLLGCVMCGLLGISCRSALSPAAAATPEDAFHHLQNVLKERDYGGLYDLLSDSWRLEIARYLASDDPSTQRQFKAQGHDVVRLRRLPPREAFIAMTRSFAEINPVAFEAPGHMVRIAPAEITGSFATVRSRAADGHVEEFHFTRERRQWKLDHWSRMRSGGSG